MRTNQQAQNVETTWLCIPAEGSPVAWSDLALGMASLPNESRMTPGWCYQVEMALVVKTGISIPAGKSTHA